MLLTCIFEVPGLIRAITPAMLTCLSLFFQSFQADAGILC